MVTSKMDFPFSVHELTRLSLADARLFFMTCRESDFTWSPVPVVEFTQQGIARGLPSSTGNRWTTPLEAMYCKLSDGTRTISREYSGTQR